MYLGVSPNTKGFSQTRKSFCVSKIVLAGKLSTLLAAKMLTYDQVC